MDINIYKYVVALYKNQTFSRTARKLYLTQPALTNAIKRLENELNTQLLNRDVVPPTFTESGKLFLKYASQIVKLDEIMRDELDLVASKKSRSLKIAANRASFFVFCKYIPKLNKLINPVPIEFFHVDANTVESYLSDGIVELAVLTTPFLRTNYESINLSTVPMLFAMNRNHEILKGKYIDKNNSASNPVEIELDELKHKKFIRLSDNLSTGHYIKNFIEKYHIEPSGYITANDNRYGLYICAVTDAIMLLPIGTYQNLPDYVKPVYCTIKDIKLSRDVMLVKNKNRKLSSEAKKIWEYFQLK